MVGGSSTLAYFWEGEVDAEGERGILEVGFEVVDYFTESGDWLVWREDRRR